MKIKRAVAVAFLGEFGFSKAAEWDAEKIVSKLNQVPEKVEAPDVPEEYKALYQEICDAKGQIEIVGGSEKSVKSEEPAKELPLEDGADETEAEEPPAKSAKKTKPAAASKAESKKPAADKKAKTKPAPAPKKEVERDAYGSRKGTISAKVNKVLGAKWKSEEEIAEESGATLDQARGRLYYAEVEGIIERRKRIEYRLVPAKEIK